MFPHLLSRLLGLAQVSWSTACVGAHYLSLSPSISRCFSIHSSPTIGFQSCFFFTTHVSAPIRATLHLITLMSFKAWDWSWYPMLWSQRGNMGCAWSVNLVSNFCPGRGLNLGSRSLMAANVATRLRRTPAPLQNIIFYYNLLYISFRSCTLVSELKPRISSKFRKILHKSRV